MHQVHIICFILFCNLFRIRTQARPVLVSAADLELMGLSGSSGRLYVSKAQRAQETMIRLETVTVAELSVSLDSEDRIEFRYVW